jgi:hypothetical protein
VIDRQNPGSNRRLRRLLLDRRQKRLGQLQQLGVALGSCISEVLGQRRLLEMGVQPRPQRLDADSELWKASAQCGLETAVGVLDGLGGDVWSSQPRRRQRWQR